MYERGRRSDGRCFTEDCKDAAVVKGMCGACRAWELYHLKHGHGAIYFTKYRARNQRLLSRAKAFSAPRRKSLLRAVK